MSPVSGVTEMNIAGQSDEALKALRTFFARVAEHGTDEGKAVAAPYLAAIDKEIEIRGRAK